MKPQRVLLTEEQISTRVKELAKEISRYYRSEPPLVLGVMNGALFFLTDLLREMDLETEISCVRLASYQGMQSTGDLRGLESFDEHLAGRHVLIVDDILDSGLTLTGLVGRVRAKGAAEVRICVLLQKDRARNTPIAADWIGFKIADEFVVGYGLDYNGRYRGLKDICVLAAES